MRLFYKSLISLIVVILIIISYFTFIGIETDKFNRQISNKIKGINQNLSIELKKIKLILDPIKFKVNVKTIGPKIKNKNKTIEIESIKTLISLKSLIDKKFSIENLEISTKSIEINNLISFIRSLNNTPELFVLEKITEKGYFIADIKLEFNKNGKIKNNYRVNGFVKDAKLNFFEKYKVDKLNFIFDYKKNDLILNDISLFLNDLNFNSNKLTIQTIKNEFFVNGNINNQKIKLKEKNLNLFFKPFFPNIDLKRLIFSSNNIFSFNINKKLNLKNLEIKSKISINEFLIGSNLSLEEVFPNFEKKISFSNNSLELNYKKKRLSLIGNGDILIQNNKDFISYSLEKTSKLLNFKTTYEMINNPLKIDLLNFKKEKSAKTVIDIEGSLKSNNQIFIKLLSLKEGNNKIGINDIVFNKKLNIVDLNKIELDYFDKEKKKNFIKLFKKNKDYYIKGSHFNANVLIDKLLHKKGSKSDFFNLKNKVNIKIDKLNLDNEFELENFSGFLSYQNQKLFKADLEGIFSNGKKLKFTSNTINSNQITTLFVDEAKPIVGRYKFIKGFDEGKIDFYSSKKNNVSNSTIKIYDFKLKEMPVLTKILTLASLQGIADILSGEGIRFDEFEMNFTNKENLMTIEEIYAIGPAISILMDGYVEKNKLISLRGTLVPATTINKFIGSLPVLGKILVGTKTGEGVFGVSFKIKGPPKNLETTVNPIKTLTPRFITRTLEKIKKN
tara:strand:- start:3246 stop:5432 length:2187 start_codon:yes stop_codon:yes gene_type:complete